MFEQEKEIFENYLNSQSLKYSKQRIEILETFLENNCHLTADQLYQAVLKRNSNIGYATIYRTLNLFCKCGLSRELKLDDGVTRYEHLYGHDHHDHLICLQCGSMHEIVSPEIEELQEKIARNYGYTLEKHKFELYGVCPQCQN